MALIHSFSRTIVVWCGVVILPAPYHIEYTKKISLKTIKYTYKNAKSNTYPISFIQHLFHLQYPNLVTFKKFININYKRKNHKFYYNTYINYWSFNLIIVLITILSYATSLHFVICDLWWWIHWPFMWQIISCTLGFTLWCKQIFAIQGISIDIFFVCTGSSIWFLCGKLWAKTQY